MTLRKIFLAAAAFSLVLAACGGGTSETTTSDAGGTAAPAPNAPANTAAPATTSAPATTGAPATTSAPGTTLGPSASNAELAAFYAALNETSAVTSAQMEGGFTIVGGEGLPADMPVTVSFSGAFDNVSGDFSMSIDLGAMLEAGAGLGEEIPPEFAGLFSSMEIRQIGDTAYVKFPFFNMFLGIETDWLALPAEDAEGVGDFTGGFVPTNPTDFLSGFDGVDATIEDLGPETIRGVKTTHYRVTVDAEAMAAGDNDALASLGAQDLSGIEELPVHFWIADDGLLHKFEIVVDGAEVATEEGEGFESMVVTFEIFGYNDPIVVEAPDPADVTDADDLGSIFGDF